MSQDLAPAVEPFDRSRLAGLYDPHRFAEVARLHRGAFAWKAQGRIPLGIHVVNPAHAAHLNYDEWLNPKPFLQAQIRFLADTLEVGSDLLPVVAINHTGDVQMPTMFGAEVRMPVQAGATLQDIGPTPLPVLRDIEEVESLEIPSLAAGIHPYIERFGRYYRQHLPDWVHVVGPMPVGPFSAAMELRGSAMLTDLVDRPELCKKLIDLCAELQCRVKRYFYDKVHARPGDNHLTNFAIASPSVRLGDDSICHLSPQMIRHFCRPGYRHINARCGGSGHVHFCSLGKSRYEHVYQALLEMPEVGIVSSQFAFEYYAQHLAELRGRLAMESFYGEALAYVGREYGSFARWARGFVRRYKDQSGLVLYCQVASVEEGKELWAYWQEAHP